MRNKFKIISSTLVVSLILPVVVLAQNTNTETTKQERSSATSVADKRMERVSGLKRMALTQVQRTEKAIKQLSEMIGKIERAMEALKEKGADTNSLQTSLDKAKTLKAEAETMLAQLKAKHDAIDPESTTSKRAVQAFQTEMNSIKKKLIELHRSLTNIVKQMRSLEKPIKPEETE